jgi:hypothetical protein
MTLDGEALSLKEYTIAVDVFGRPDSFDTRLASIVRVEAARLRKKLELYYRTAGIHDRLVIELPRNSYVPVLSIRDHSQRAERPERPLIGIVDSRQDCALPQRMVSKLSQLCRLVPLCEEVLAASNEVYDLVVVCVDDNRDYSWLFRGFSKSRGVMFVSDLLCFDSLLLYAESMRQKTEERSIPQTPNWTAQAG